MIFRQAFEKTPHCHRGDEPCHLAAQAEMLACAKAEMTLWPAVDIVDIRVGELPPIAIAGAEGECHFVADAQCLAVQRDRTHDRALEALCRRVEAQRFL